METRWGCGMPGDRIAQRHPSKPQCRCCNAGWRHHTWHAQGNPGTKTHEARTQHIVRAIAHAGRGLATPTHGQVARACGAKFHSRTAIVVLNKDHPNLAHHVHTTPRQAPARTATPNTPATCTRLSKACHARVYTEGWWWGEGGRQAPTPRTKGKASNLTGR